MQSLALRFWRLSSQPLSQPQGYPATRHGKHTFELRLASHEKMEGWEKVPGPRPQNTPVWISPEVALSQPRRGPRLRRSDTGGQAVRGSLAHRRGRPEAGTPDQVSHRRKLLAIMLDGRVTSVPKIMAEITGGRAMIIGNFTEEETDRSRRGSLSSKQEA